MKRIVICCDGTWNRLDAAHPTNVVKLAQSVLPTDSRGVTQATIYVEGVGTGRGTGRLAKLFDRLGGGAFGHGLIANIEDAYRQLVFLYEPGDEIYIVGFSRGGYTARSLAGLIRSSGIIGRKHVAKVPEAVLRYQKRGKESHPDVPDNCAFRANYSPLVATSPKDLEWRERNRPDLIPDSFPLKITYVGVWDTVGALGVPDTYRIAKLFNRKYQFHDTALSSSVSAARHAVALDERRATFPPALWGNLDDLNSRVADASRKGKPQYQQVWFPGDHGSVGGGGDILGLSNAALLWIAEGAVACGLEFEPQFLKQLRQDIDHRAALCNQSKPDKGFFSRLMSMQMMDRKGPSHLTDLAQSARMRWAESKGTLPEKRPYRPATLRTLENDLEKWQHDADSQPDMPFEEVAS
jgi:uncharacterized protein (DUF2235 family)|tara:strand:+ start:12502 stop:13728 length:1227 start_codon:yes stop_codon:yes gene_type:complete